MDLIQILVVIVVVGVALWAINTYLPMQQPMKGILNVIVILVVCAWLLSVVGVFGTHVHWHMR